MNLLFGNATQLDLPNHARLRWGFWLALIVFAALHSWKGRFYVNPDGISYLDIADAYRRGDWQNAINAYWSPMYSCVLAVGLDIFKPSRYLESTFLHLIGLFIFVCSLAAFEFFISELLRSQVARDEPGRGLVSAVPPNALRALGYGVFLWSWLSWLSGAILVTPDTLMTFFVYLAAGLLLRIRSGQDRWTLFALLGICLGLGYLTKSAMFPLSFVFLAVAWFAVRERPKALARVSVALLAFFLVAVPWIAVLSFSKKRLTFGDAGRVNYVAFANGETDRQSRWPLYFPDDERLVHPTRRLLQRPALYAFASPVSGTYPLWYDPSYWHEGEKLRFELRGQLRVLSRSARDLWHMLLRDESFLFAGVAGVFLLAFRGGRGTRRLVLAPQWVLFAPAVAGILMYSLVHLEPRLIGVFCVPIWLGLFAGFYQEPIRGQGRVGWAVSLAILLVMAVRIGPDTVSVFRSTLHSVAHPVAPSANSEWQTAQALGAIGIRPGDGVAVIGHTPEAYWARLAGVRIAAEIHSAPWEFESVPDHDLILQPDGSLTQEAISAFASTGARAVVAAKIPANVALHGWTALGGTGFYAYRLDNRGGAVPLIAKFDSGGSASVGSGRLHGHKVTCT